MAGWGRCGAFQVLECGPLEQAVIGVQSTECYADSIGGQQQSQQRKQVFQVLVGAIEQLVVEIPLLISP